MFGFVVYEGKCLCDVEKWFLEVGGGVELVFLGFEFCLCGCVDWIDLMVVGDFVVIDYKIG